MKVVTSFLSCFLFQIPWPAWQNVAFPLSACPELWLWRKPTPALPPGFICQPPPNLPVCPSLADSSFVPILPCNYCGRHCPSLLNALLGKNLGLDAMSQAHWPTPKPAALLMSGAWGTHIVMNPWAHRDVRYWLFSFQIPLVNLKERFRNGRVIRMMCGSFPAGWTAWKPA